MCVIKCSTPTGGSLTLHVVFKSCQCDWAEAVAIVQEYRVRNSCLFITQSIRLPQILMWLKCWGHARWHTHTERERDTHSHYKEGNWDGLHIRKCSVPCFSSSTDIWQRRGERQSQRKCEQFRERMNKHDEWTIDFNSNNFTSCLNTVQSQQCCRPKTRCFIYCLVSSYSYTIKCYWSGF